MIDQIAKFIGMYLQDNSDVKLTLGPPSQSRQTGKNSPHPTCKQPTISMSRCNHWYRIIRKSRSEETSGNHLVLLTVDSRALKSVYPGL